MDINLKDVAIMGAVSLLGSVTHAVNQLRLARTKRSEFTKVDFAILFFLAVPSGLFFGLGSHALGWDFIRSIFATALGSFLGIAGLAAISDALLDVAVFLVKTRGNSFTPQPPKDDKTN